jgi:hemoglobin/transferrin/lactoferrin receptor protein
MPRRWNLTGGHPGAMAGVFAALLALTPPVAAEPAAPVDELVVTARRRLPLPAPAGPAPLSTRDREDIERSQASSVFAVVADVPGVAVNGGPRSSGMKFNIRGFSDTEDVIVEVDGISRGFEKYRFGSGVFIEPELLQRLDVERTPSLAAGSGALGGSVRATTRDAADLLAEGQRVGLFAKSGYASNNDERLLAGAVYAAPTPRIGLLASGSTRNSNATRLPDGTRLAGSETDGDGYLGKLTIDLGTATTLRTSITGFRSQALQPYDATGGQPGFFGTVERAIDDQTIAISLDHAPAGSAWRATGVAGRVTSQLDDLLRPGATPFATATTGNVRDRYEYATHVVRLDAAATPPGTGGRLALAAGLQFIDSARDIARVTENASLNASLYPGGFFPAQPPGDRRSLGLYLQPELTLGRLALHAGARLDRYDVTARGGAAEALAAAGEAARISLAAVTPAWGLRVAVVPDRLTWFYRHSEAFRPPLTDEYFTQGAFGRCIRPFLGELAPPSGICGDRYVPEEARTDETGIAWRDALGPLALDLRTSVFRTRVRQTLESLTVVAPGQIGQPGREAREGFEAEARFAAGLLFGRASYSRLRGSAAGPAYSGALPDLPGDRIAAFAGVTLANGRVELGYRLEDVASRLVTTGFTGNVPAIGTQAGYRLHGLFATLRAGDAVELRATVDNATNATYRLNDGFGGGPGTVAPGRNLGVTVTARW